MFAVELKPFLVQEVGTAPVPEPKRASGSQVGKRMGSKWRFFFEFALLCTSFLHSFHTDHPKNDL